ncbi:phosphoglycerate dehydrogenase [Nesterenkonia populi]
MKALITPTSLSKQPDHPALDPLRQAGAEIMVNPYGRPMAPDELIEALDGVEGVIAGLDSFTEEVFAAADSLRVIARYGVGYDRIDLEAAQRAEVRVTNAPGANGHSVAELALGLMFAVARQIPQTSSAVAAGQWPRFQGIELAGRRLGVLGLGFIGRGLARMASGIGMDVCGFDPGLTEEQIRGFGVTPAGQDEIFSRCDVLSLHIPLNEHTRHLVSAQRIAGMPQGAIIINTARGGLIDEQAAAEALDAGQLHGIGLDAYETEPPTGSPLVGHPRVVATPHSGAHSEESVARTASAAVENLLAAMRGEEPPSPIV